MNSLKGRISLISGGASGIGRATATLFASEGALVAIADIDQIKGEEVVQQIQRAGGDSIFTLCDVTKLEDCKRAVEHTVQTFGGLDILCNCAGIIRRANVIELEEEEWDRVLNVNAKSSFLLSKFTIPVMQKSGGGSIVFTASGWGLKGGPKAVAYCAAKGAVVQLTRALAIDHGEDNIRVNCVCPGDTDTPMLRHEAKQLGQSEEAFLTEAASRPLGRIGKPEEIAQAFLYLASEQSSFVTGATLVVDGGGLA